MSGYCILEINKNYMPKLICVKCETELKPLENGISLAELFSNSEKIYRILQADMWHCPVCGYKVVAGIADKGLEHYENNLDKKINELKLMKKTIVYNK